MSAELTLGRHRDFDFYHIRGSGAADSLSGRYETLPDRWFRYQQIEGGGFLARLGDREFYIFGPVGTLPDKKTFGTDTFVFPRSDAVFFLNGNASAAFLCELCAYDFSTSEPEEFILANMAGVSCWFRMSAAQPMQVLMGCDPSYGDYIADTLTRTLSEFLSECRRKEMT